MQHKANYLFDIDKLLPRPIPEQARFEKDYYDFLTTMPDLVDLAYEMTKKARKQKDPRSINKNWFANEMSGNLGFLIAREFPEYIRHVRGTYCLNMNYEYECYVKRLSKGLQPSYKHSNTSWANYNQKAVSSKELLPIIYVGYTASKSNDKVTGYYAVCLKGKERLWFSDLSSLAPPNFGTSSSEEPVTPLIPTPEVKVGVRTKKQVK